MDTYQIGLVIPIYSTCYIDQIIPLIFKTNARPDLVVCIVNDGQPQVKDHLEKMTLPPQVLIHNLPENRRFAGANNAGWTILLKKYPTLKYLGSLNDDTIPRDRWLDPLINALNNYPRTAIAMPIMETNLGLFKTQKDFAIWELTETGSMRPVKQKISTDTFSSAVNGFCFMGNREALESVGFFDENFHNSCEDLDLGIKLMKNNWRLVVCKDSRVYHHGGASRYLKGAKTNIGYSQKLLAEKWGLNLTRYNKIQPKTIACCIAFNQEHIIEAWVRNTISYADEILVMYSKFPWMYNPAAKSLIQTDSTGEILKRLQIEFPKLNVFEKEWANETDERTYSLKIARTRGAKILLIVDSDEFFEASKIFQAFDWMKENPADLWMMHHVQLIKQINWAIITPDGNPAFQFAVNVDQVKFFSDKRIPVAEQIKTIPEDTCVCWHFSYFMPYEKLHQKLTTFGHTREIQKNWLEKVYVKLIKESKNFHPVTPEGWSGIKEVHVPEEIKKLIDWNNP